jgi:energy-coupling factor transporter ATP-binding protein EcfA2
LKNFGFAPGEAAERRKWAMECVGLGEALLTRDPANLSFGERRKVALASVIALKPKYLILDEPLAGLDWHGRRHLTETIARLTSEGLTTLILTHETDLVAEIGDTVSVLDRGCIVGPVSPEVFLNPGEACPDVSPLEAASSPWAGLLPDFALAIHKVRAHGHLLPPLPRRIDDAVGLLAEALRSQDV